jgi:O-6-methylguanine DNA methyltransferase
MVAVASDRGLCLLEFARGRGLAARVARLAGRRGTPVVRGTNSHLDRLARELRAYFAGSLRTFRVSLAPEGTPFQRAVWRRVRAIRYGCVSSYDRVARALRRPGAQRAVGRANGDNPLSIVIPCHRLVGTDGALRGYGGGLWRKRRLLELEGAIAAKGPPRSSR